MNPGKMLTSGRSEQIESWAAALCNAERACVLSLFVKMLLTLFLEASVIPE
jgi:hypothetical protein